MIRCRGHMDNMNCCDNERYEEQSTVAIIWGLFIVIYSFDIITKFSPLLKSIKFVFKKYDQIFSNEWSALYWSESFRDQWFGTVHFKDSFFFFFFKAPMYCT